MKQGEYLCHLEKERKFIKPAYIKNGHNDTTIVAEAEALSVLFEKQFSVPDIYIRTNENLVTEQITGSSVFRVIEYLAKHERFAEMESVLKALCEHVVEFQKVQFSKIEAKGVYEIDAKIADVVCLLDEGSYKEAQVLREIHPQIVRFFKEHAAYRFRDATPKNFIMRGCMVSDTLDACVGDIAPQNIVAIDFSSVEYLTLCEDDFISVLYHYMIPDVMRKKMLDMFVAEQDTLAFHMSLVVRLARFWVRREYYEVYKNDVYKKRYQYENKKFYTEQFFAAIQKIKQQLQK